MFQCLSTCVYTGMPVYKRMSMEVFSSTETKTINADQFTVGKLYVADISGRLCRPSNELVTVLLL